MDAKRLPMVIGCDAAGVTADGREVVVHSIISAPDAEERYGNELYDPKMSMLSEMFDGTFATKLAVPERNLIDKPKSLSFEEGSCLGVAYLTAYRALFTQAGLEAGQTILVQRRGRRRVDRGGDPRPRPPASRCGSPAAARSAASRPRGSAPIRRSRPTRSCRSAWTRCSRASARPPGQHSLKALKPGGIVVCVGSTSGPNPPSDLQRVFIRQIRIQGSMMGTKKEMIALLELLDRTKVKPLIDRTLPLEAWSRGVRADAGRGPVREDRPDGELTSDRALTRGTREDPRALRPRRPGRGGLDLDFRGG